MVYLRSKYSLFGIPHFGAVKAPQNAESFVVDSLD